MSSKTFKTAFVDPTVSAYDEHLARLEEILR